MGQTFSSRARATLALAGMVSTALVAIVGGAAPAWAATYEFTAVASSSSGGTVAPAISANGRYVAFHTAAALLAEDGNTTIDVYLHDRATGALELVSTPATPGGLDVVHQHDPSISADGDRVVWTRTSFNMGAAGSDRYDVLVKDRSDGSVVSMNQTTIDTSGLESRADDISDDGTTVVFTTEIPAQHLVSGVTDSNAASDVIRARIVAGAPVTRDLISTDTDGTETQNGPSHGASTNADGSVVTFLSAGTDVMTDPPIHNSLEDVWIGSGGAPTPLTGIVSRGPTPGAWVNSQPRMLTDGRVVFLSEEPFDAADTNGTADVYVAALLTDGVSYERLSMGSGGQLYEPVVSMDVTAGATHLAFETADDTVVDGAVVGTASTHVYLVDRATGTTVLVDAALDGSTHAGNHSDPVVSDAGDVIAFVSPDGLAPSDSNGYPDVVVGTPVDTIETSGPIELVSRTVHGYAGDGPSTAPAMSHDGQVLAYESVATDLASDGLTAVAGRRYIHVHDRAAVGHHTERMLSSTGELPNGESFDPWISGDGRYVAFTTAATNLATDGDAGKDVVVWDRQTDTFEIASVDNVGEPVLEHADLAAMSDNGRYVLFATIQQLSTLDTNTVADLYLRDRTTATTTLVSERTDVVTESSRSTTGDVSDDGRVVFAVGEMVAGSEQLSVYARDVIVGSAPTVTLAKGITTFMPQPRIAAGGSTAVFRTNRVEGYPDLSSHQIIAYDFASGGFRLISHSMAGSQEPVGDPPGFSGTTAGNIHGPATISPDGRYVAFDHTSNDIATTAGTGTTADSDLFVHDRVTDTIRHANISPDTAGFRSVFSPVVDASGTIVAWSDSHAPYFPVGANPDTNTHYDIYRATYTAPPDARTIEDVRLDVTTSAGGQPAGLDTVPIAGIPVESIPFASVALAAAPLRSIDLEAAPLRSIPLRSIPLRSIPLRSITLSQLPLDLPGGWAQRLVGTTLEGAPLQTVTLAQVEAVPPATDAQGQPLPHPLDGIDLSEVGIQSSPLRSIGIASIALGSTPLRSIPLRSIDTQNDPAAHICPMTGDVPTTDTQALTNWTDLLTCLGFGGAVDATTSLIDIDIAGAPLRSIPLRSIPLRSIDLQSSPLRSIPLRSIELQATPLRSIPLRSIELDVAPLRSIPLRSIPLRSIDVNASPLRSIPLRSIPLRSIVVDCTDTRVDCTDTTTQTLGDVADISLDLIIGDLEDLGDTLAGYTLGDLMGAYGEVTIGDVLDWVATETDLPASIRDMSLIDLLVGLLLRTDYPWEELPVADMGLQNVAPTPELVDAELSYRVTGDPVPGATTTITVTLPAGARYAPGTSYLEVLQTDTGFTAILPDPAVNGNTLTYALNSDYVGSTVSLGLRYRPGVRLVAERATATISLGETAMLEAPVESTSYDVIERDRSDDDPATAPLLAGGDTLVVGHIAHAGDIDYYRIPATVVAGKRVSIDLAVPGVDQDLVLYSPADAAGVIDSAPLRSIPLRSIAVEDQGAVAPGETVPPETLQDIPLRSIPLRSISANRESTDEHVDVLANEDDDGFYTIQVSGYNGATSTEPYVLRMRLLDPPAELQCSPRTFPHAVTAPTSQTASSAPAGTDTLFVVNPSRIDATYGAGQGATVVSALGTLAGRGDLDVHGHVLAVDHDERVRAAYAAWDAAPCSPNAANEVVDAIVAVVEASHASAGGNDAGYTIPNIVLVGADDVLPQARIPDLTRLSNERDYLVDVGADNPLAGAFATEHLLSDDPYGDRDPIPWLNRLMYVPDAALGRLVETPAEIVAAVDRFQTWGGTLDPSTATSSTTSTATADPQDALVTGYDFLADGAHAVADGLDASFGAANVDRSLINEQWTRTELVDAFLGPDIPYIASINAHFDHHRSLPALGNATHSEDDLFTTADVVDPDGDDQTVPPSLDKRLLFSMGCHSGLSVPDVYVSGIEDDDWAQAFGRQGAGAFVGNTGYGYGDTAAVALSELLMAGFAQRLDGSMTVGQAMVYAKQAYAGQLGLYGAYDEKVLAEATFFGLPMFRVKGAPTSPVAGAKIPTVPVATGNAGVQSSSFSLGATALAIAEKTAPDGSTFLTAGGDVPQVTNGRPITPRTDLDVTADTDTPARGVLLTGLTSSETSVARAAFARAVVDHSTHELAVATDVAFPASFASVNRFRDPSGERSSLVLLPGQFIPDDDPATVGSGTRRTFTEMSGIVYYSDDADVTPPTVTATSAWTNGTTVGFEAELVDTQSPIMRALVLYRDASGPWKSAELLPGAGGTWRGSGTTLSDKVEYYLQAVDVAGNVAAASNKAFLFAAAADRIAPTVEILSPAGGSYEVGTALTVDFACDDANLRDCSGTLNGEPIADGATVDTSRASSGNVLSVTGTDASGNATTTTVSFDIDYVFVGFSAPLASGERTTVKAGSAVPVRWQLRDANGFVGDRSAILDISSYPLACGETAEATATMTATTEVSGLTYDAETDEWQYVWKTEKGWTGCRQLVITFADGQTASAVFTMK